MMDIHRIIGKLPHPKRGFVLYRHKYTGPYNPLDRQLDKNDQPLPGQEPYNTVDAISMRHDICYRDNNTKEGKQTCDDKMLNDFDSLEPKDLREKTDKTLVRTIIGTKRRIGWGLKWNDELADELHKPIRKKFKKRHVFSSNVDSIWAADLVEMKSFSKQNKGCKYILMIIDIFSKFGWAIPLKTKTGKEVAEAFSELWKKGTSPARLYVDKGTEFYNKF